MITPGFGQSPVNYPVESKDGIWKLEITAIASDNLVEWTNSNIPGSLTIPLEVSIKNILQDPGYVRLKVIELDNDEQINSEFYKLDNLNPDIEKKTIHYTPKLLKQTIHLKFELYPPEESKDPSHIFDVELLTIDTTKMVDANLSKYAFEDNKGNFNIKLRDYHIFDFGDTLETKNTFTDNDCTKSILNIHDSQYNMMPNSTIKHVFTKPVPANEISVICYQTNGIVEIQSIFNLVPMVYAQQENDITQIDILKEKVIFAVFELRVKCLDNSDSCYQNVNYDNSYNLLNYLMEQKYWFAILVVAMIIGLFIARKKLFTCPYVSIPKKLVLPKESRKK